MRKLSALINLPLAYNLYIPIHCTYAPWCGALLAPMHSRVLIAHFSIKNYARGCTRFLGGVGAVDLFIRLHCLIEFTVTNERGQRQRRKTKPNNSIKSSQVQLISELCVFTLFGFYFVWRTARFQLFAHFCFRFLFSINFARHKSAENGDNLNDSFFRTAFIYWQQKKKKCDMPSEAKLAKVKHCKHCENVCGFS